MQALLEVDYTGAWCRFTTLFLITLSSSFTKYRKQLNGGV